MIIKNNERAIVIKKGKVINYLQPGKQQRPIFSEIVRFNIYEVLYLPLDIKNQLLKMETFIQDVIDVKILDNQIGLLYKNGIYKEILESGEYLFWKNEEDIEVKVYTMDQEEINEEVIPYIPVKYYTRVVIDAFSRGILNINKSFKELLEPGVYYFWTYNNTVECEAIDTRVQVFDMVGQEMLTKDKVTLRINFMCRYKVVDIYKVVSTIQNYKEQLYLNVQIALREYIGNYKLDEILENKANIAMQVVEKIKEKEADYAVEFYDANIKDIILPGEIREIMNTVLVAEKKAQANVILRREEVASTRSLLNTAKLMDENKTLYKLKELEYIEKICDNVGNISLSTDKELLSQLTQVLG